MTRDYSQFFAPSAHGPATPPQSPLTQLGWHPFFAQQISADALHDTPPVRVVAVHRSGLQVQGDGIDQMIPPGSEATVGDWLCLDRAYPAHSVVLRRKSLLKRRAPGTDRRLQLIAANVDTVFVVTSCNADFNLARLERYVALALEAEITPVILLTKADLVDDVAPYLAQLSSLAHLAEAVALDARNGEVRKTLAPWCKPGQTVAFLGSSGVGKSTLTNALLGDGDVATQGIREDDAKGRHTTTARHLHAVPGGCLVLDTPGMRELQLTDAVAGLADVFADLEELAQTCRFGDCQHNSEPGCAIQAAVEAGEVDAARLARWRKLQAEEAYNAASLAERRSKDRAFGKRVRAITKCKDKRKWRL